MRLNSLGAGLYIGNGIEQTGRRDQDVAHSHVLTTLVKTYMGATAAPTDFQAAKHLAFPQITMWQSHVVTVVFFGVISALAVYVALGGRSELLSQVQRELAERRRAEAQLACLPRATD